MPFLSVCSTSVSGAPLGLSDMFNAPSTTPKLTFTAFASKPGGFSFNPLSKKCAKCAGEGGIECPGCKGTGRNKKNGNIFERWKCYDCQGFGMKSCPKCGRGGLTPEQRGER